LAFFDTTYLDELTRGYNCTSDAVGRPSLPSLIQGLEAYHQDSWGWALACCNWQHSLADDILQESYLRVLDGRARFGGRATQKTWFFGVIKRVALELSRKQQTLGWRLFDSLAPNDEGHVADAGFDATDHAEVSQQLRLALQQMPQRQREVLHLVFYAELTLEEAAHSLGIGLGSVRTHYHRGKSRLAQLLEINDA
jgi:RNA polymerase sigma factor (sigma-70 family)